MKLVAAAIILFFSITISVAGNFTPIPKNKIAQSNCVSQCQNLFNLCLLVCGQFCLSDVLDKLTPPNKPVVFRNCDLERVICVRNCPATGG
jgi:hypothetical protein